MNYNDMNVSISKERAHEIMTILENAVPALSDDRRARSAKLREQFYDWYMNESTWSQRFWYMSLMYKKKFVDADALAKYIYQKSYSDSYTLAVAHRLLSIKKCGDHEFPEGQEYRWLWNHEQFAKQFLDDLKACLVVGAPVYINKYRARELASTLEYIADGKYDEKN